MSDADFIQLHYQLIHTCDVRAGIRDDQGVTGFISREMAVLRHQWTQGGKDLGGAGIFERDNLGDIKIVAVFHVVFGRNRQVARIAVHHDPHNIAAFYSGETVHVK